MIKTCCDHRFPRDDPLPRLDPPPLLLLLLPELPLLLLPRDEDGGLYDGEGEDCAGGEYDDWSRPLEPEEREVPLLLRPDEVASLLRGLEDEPRDDVAFSFEVLLDLFVYPVEFLVAPGSVDLVLVEADSVLVAPEVRPLLAAGSDPETLP